MQTSPGLYLKQHLHSKSPEDFKKERKRTLPEEVAEADDVSDDDDGDDVSLRNVNMVGL